MRGFAIIDELRADALHRGLSISDSSRFLALGLTDEDRGMSQWKRGRTNLRRKGNQTARMPKMRERCSVEKTVVKARASSFSDLSALRGSIPCGGREWKE